VTQYKGVIAGGILATAIFVVTILFPNAQVTSALQLKDISGQLIAIFVIITALVYLISAVKHHHILHPTERGLLGGLTAVYAILSFFAIPAIQIASVYLADFKLDLVTNLTKYY